MPERPVVPDDSAPIEHPPPLDLSREPHDGADDAHEADDADGHDPYQPL
jgi:hypothetical protein